MRADRLPHSVALPALCRKVDALRRAWKPAAPSHDREPVVISEARRVAAFIHEFNVLTEGGAAQTFGLSVPDIDYLLSDQLLAEDSASWRRHNLHIMRAKTAVHIRSAIEALEAYQRYGFAYKALVPPKFDPAPVMHDLGSLNAWLLRHGQNIEQSTIDPELFAACLRLSKGRTEEDQQFIEAERTIARVLGQILFGMALVNVSDAGNLWWAVKIAISSERILRQLPSGTEDGLSKAVSLVSLALLKDIPPVVQNPHPLVYTPEIYGAQGLRTYCLALINILEIQTWFVRVPMFRRRQYLWSVMEDLDDRVDENWEQILRIINRAEHDLSNGNLYLLALVNRAIVYWLALSRTRQRWSVLQDAYDIRTRDDQRISTTTIVANLQVGTLGKVGTSNEEFAAQIDALAGAMRRNVCSGFVRQPFTIAICGPPGAGKTFLAKQLLESINEDRDNRLFTKATRPEDIPQPLNLTNTWPTLERAWEDYFTLARCWKGMLQGRNGEQHLYQGFIIDEADAGRLGSSTEFAYKWLLGPLRERWKNIAWPGRDPIPTFVFVIASKYHTWSDWYLAVNSPRVEKGEDFARRIEDKINIPNMPPEEQLLLAAKILQEVNGDRSIAVDITVAQLLARSRFEYQAGSVESFVKQCDLPGIKQEQQITRHHLPQAGDFSIQTLLFSNRDAGAIWEGLRAA